MHPKDVEGIANSVDLDQRSTRDLGLHCLPRSVFQKQEHYSTSLPTHMILVDLGEERILYYRLLSPPLKFVMLLFAKLSVL